jgi:serine/threonine protein kinase/formylglycine-generating enzyme required for sulfatase activity
MGTVFEAIQESLDRRVAVKVLRGAAMMDDRAIRRFHREAAAIAKLHHPNIISVISVGEQEGTHFYAMELLEGVSLARVISTLRRGTPSPDPFDPKNYKVQPAGIETDKASAEGAAHTPRSHEPSQSGPRRGGAGTRGGQSSWTLTTNRHFVNAAVEMIAQVADALHHVHEHEIIHRDIKPSNLLLASPHHLVLMDFGLAHEESGRNLTMTGDFMGTPMYMSPEQATAGRVPIDRRTDIYSLGVTLYELLTLTTPYQGASTHGVLRQVLVKEPNSFRKLNLRLPWDLEVITFKALEKDPDRRYQTAKDFADDLRRFLHYEAIQARPPGPFTRLWRRMRRHRAGVVTAVSALVLACLVTTLVIGHARWQQSARVHQFIEQGNEELAAAQESTNDTEAERHFEEAIQSFTGALAIRDQDQDASRGLFEAYLQRCRRALDHGNYEVARGILIPLRKLDARHEYSERLTAFEREAVGTGTLQMETSPPDCHVALARVNADFQAGPWEEIGTTPLPPQDIAPGNYLVRLSLHGWPDVRFPLLVEHNQTKKLDVQMVPGKEIPPGMVYVPSGDFWFGDRQTGSGKRISLPGYFIDRTEVTGADYEKFVKATNTPAPEEWGGPVCPPPLRASAVHNVSWFAAMEYARWAGKRLPTEAEWEKAARGVDGRIYPWGNHFEAWRCNCRETPIKDWLVAGRYPGGASPYGCLDMAGNVWEWTMDREKPHHAPRIMRGGAAYGMPEDLATYRRQGAPPGGSDFGGLNLIGFRCVKSLAPESPRPPLLEELSSPEDLDKAAEYYWGRQPSSRQADRTRQCARRLLAKNPRSVVGNFWEGVCLLSEGKNSEALAAFKVAYLQRPAFRTSLEYLLQLRGHLSPSAAEAEFAFLEVPRMFQQVEKALDENKPADADKLLQKILSLDSENAVAHEKMAEVCKATSRPKEMTQHRLKRIQAYRIGLKEDPENADLYNEFADLLSGDELYVREGLEAAERAVQLDPNRAEYHSTLASFYFRLHQQTEAQKEIAKALQLEPSETRYLDQQKEYLRRGKRAKGKS